MEASQLNPDRVMALLIFAATGVVGLTYASVLLWRFVRRRWIKIVVFNALFLLNVIAGTALLGEVYFRVYFDSTDSFASSMVHQLWMSKNWRENSTGFRDDRNYQLRTRAGAKRAVIIGDSFTAGHGIANIQDRFGNIIRTRLPEHEVHVFAKNGWDTGPQLAALQEAVAKGYQADVVVLAYCLNDTSDINHRWGNMMARVFKKYQPEGLFAHSFFFNWLYWRAKLATDPDFQDYGGLSKQSYEGYAWDEQKRRLLSMKNLVERNGGQFAIAVLPFLNHPADQYPFTDIHRQLSEFCAAHGISFIDLQSLLTEAGTQSLVVNRFDAHPNEAAHKMIADKLTPFVREKLSP